MKVKFEFPMMGLNKNFAGTTQPQFTSPLLQNVRPYDVLEKRARGGQRPGLKRMWEQILGVYADMSQYQSLVAFWRMDELNPSGDNSLADSKGIMHLTPVIYSGQFVSREEWTRCLEFDQTQYLKSSAADGTPLDITGDLSIFLWFKTYLSAGIKALVSLYDDTNSRVQYRLYQDGLNLKGRIGTDYNGYTEYTSSVSGIQVNKWHSAVLIVSGNTVQVFLDDKEGNAVTVSGNRIAAGSDDCLTIGAVYNNGAQNYFNGRICNVMVFNGALSQQQRIDLQTKIGSPVVSLCQVTTLKD